MIKSYVDLEQSKKLAEILPLDSADMCYLSEKSLVPKVIYNGMAFFNSKEERPTNIIHCWSLAALLDVLPKGTRLLKSTNISSVNDTKYHCDCPKGNIHEWFDNPIDACYEMILKLHEQKML